MGGKINLYIGFNKTIQFLIIIKPLAHVTQLKSHTYIQLKVIFVKQLP